MTASSASATGTVPTVPVEIVSWITKFIGGDGTGRRVMEEPWAEGATVRSVLRSLSGRYPDLHAALWHGDELGEHIEILVNDAVLGITHEIDSPVTPADRIALLGQFMGGSAPASSV
jgi:molybdopterin converting factor small subunit